MRNGNNETAEASSAYALPVRIAALTATAALALTGLAPVSSGLAGAAHPAAAPRTDAADLRPVAAGTREVRYTAWDSRRQLDTGTFAGTRSTRWGRVRLAVPSARRSLGDVRYDVGRWTSPWVSPGFGLTELVPSWEAITPEGTFVEVEVRGSTSGGRRSSWDVVSRWASGDQALRRTSVAGQGDDLADVNVDTFGTDGSFTAWQVRVSLNRRVGTTLSPVLDAAGGVASRIPSSTGVATSRTTLTRDVVLPVPRFSQMIHEGHFPGYGGGGESWCSPTSLAMVLGYYGALPSSDETVWAGATHPDRVVDHLARMTYDYAYRGTGNWPFNTAYAATRVQQAFVTRFTSLRDVERLVAAGIPVITSVSFRSGELSGAPIRSTNGHLLVVVGFRTDGDVIVNDPAAATRRGVRRTYDRGQFEDAWLKRGVYGGSGGTAYVVRDADHPLPSRLGTMSW